MTFGAPQWLWGLLTLPLLTLLFVRAEVRATRRLREFISPRLLPVLAATVDRVRRSLRFALQLIALGLSLVALAQPRWGYTWEEARRKGLDVFIAIDTSRSMLSNDVQPNRLGQVKLATQDLLNTMEGDRVGVIAFAGRAFVQAPLTIDYDAVVEAITDLDTRTIPEGGTNIAEAITLATQTYGKSALGNRALIVFTDGEELDGDAVKAAKAAAAEGVRIFTIGVGTVAGSLIPLPEDSGGSSFVKDDKGQVVKSKLDEKRLREIAESTGGFYLHLENGPRTMQQLVASGLSTLHASDIDARMSRRPIERYQWPLAGAVLALGVAVLLRDRKRIRIRAGDERPASQRLPLATATALLVLTASAFSAVPGVDQYRHGKYSEAYDSFEKDLKNHPDAAVKDKMEFDAGTAAFKMGKYDKAIEAFSNALLSRDKRLQENSHFNAGRTLEERADLDKQEEDTLRDLENAQSHYEDTLKLNPHNEPAKANLEEVKKKIERLKQKRTQPTPTPPPQEQQQQKKQQDQQDESQQQQNSQNQQQQQPQTSNQQSQSQSQSQQQQQQNQSERQNQQGTGKDQKQDQQQAKNDRQKSPASHAGPSPSPSPGQGNDAHDQNNDQGGDNQQSSPSPGNNAQSSPSPTPGEGSESGEATSPSPSPSASPGKKLAGDIKDTGGQPGSQQPEAAPEAAESEQNEQGQMSERQAEALLRSMKDDEARVQLDEHRSVHRVYKDW